MKNKKKIVIYGGSFNPPHIGHAVALETVLRLFECDEVWVIPSANRIDKPDLIEGKHRYRMLEIMLKEFFSPPARETKIPVKLSRMEIDRPKLTTTLDTKRGLEKTYPEIEFWFLIGSDLLFDIETHWVDGKKLYESANFLAIKRPGYPAPKKPPKHFVLLEKGTVWPMVSSTLVRGLIREGRSPLPYVSLGVADYIKKHQLYA